MAVILGSNQGNMNGVTAVEIVPAPGSGVYRAVRSIRFFNLDTAVVTFKVFKRVGVLDYYFDGVVGLAVGGVYNPVDGDDIIALTGTDHSIMALLGGAIATLNPQFIASWVDKS